jgi:parallel beta-helix repeat protein
MIEIRTQAQFQTMKSNTSSTEMYIIYPCEDDVYYKLSSAWTIPSKAYIKGIDNPLIYYTSTTLVSTTAGIITITSPNVKLEGIYVKSNPTVTGNLNVLYIKNSGVATPDNGTSYVLAYAGNAYTNTMGSCICNCTFDGGCLNGIELNNSYNCRLINNKIINNNKYGISIGQGSSGNNIIEGNKIVNNTDCGIFIYYGNYNIITKNYIINNHTYGIRVDYYSTKNIICGNIVKSNSQHGIYISGSSNMMNNVSENIVDSNIGCGIYIYNSEYSIVSQNIVTNSGLNGIHLEPGSYVGHITLNDNIMKSNGGYGMYINGASNITGFGNVTTNNTSGAKSFSGTNLSIDSATYNKFIS